MIRYHNRGFTAFYNLLKWRGSVFPFALTIALPLSATAALMEWLTERGHLHLYGVDRPVFEQQAVWGGFTFLVGFLIVFRTNAAYGRFWDGITATHKMKAEWFDACASLLAFCKYSDKNPDLVDEFRWTCVRLFSLLHAVALAEMQECCSEDYHLGMDPDRDSWNLELMDDCFIDDRSMVAMRDSVSKPEMAFQWIQQYVVESIKREILTIPAPILSRAFEELNSGMVEFHQALKVCTVPFPFPYAQCADIVLLIHGILTPFIMSLWVNDSVIWCGVLSFVQIFLMWTLKAIAVQIENPFGPDDNDIDRCELQIEMNTQLELLLDAQTIRTPMSFYANRENITHAPTPLSKVWGHAHNRVSKVVEPIPARSCRVSFSTERNSGRGSSRGSSRKASVSGSNVFFPSSREQASPGRDFDTSGLNPKMLTIQVNDRESSRDGNRGNSRQGADRSRMQNARNNPSEDVAATLRNSADKSTGFETLMRTSEGKQSSGSSSRGSYDVREPPSPTSPLGFPGGLQESSASPQERRIAASPVMGDEMRSDGTAMEMTTSGSILDRQVDKFTLDVQPSAPSVKIVRSSGVASTSVRMAGPAQRKSRRKKSMTMAVERFQLAETIDETEAYHFEKRAGTGEAEASRLNLLSSAV